MTEKEYFEMRTGAALAAAQGFGNTMAQAAGSGAFYEDVLAALVKSTIATLMKEIGAGEKTGTEIVDLEALIPEWKKEGPAGDGVHSVGEVVTYNGQVVKCCQAHNTNNNPDILPDNLTFFVPYHTTDPKKAKPFVQPVHAESAYNIGEVCIFNGTIYRCIIGGNTYTPEAYPHGWEKVEME